MLVLAGTDKPFGALGWTVRRHRSLRRLLEPVPWLQLPRVAGFPVLAAGLERPGVAGERPGLVCRFRVGVVTGGIAALLNNLPAAFLVRSSVAASHDRMGFAVPVIAEADLGTNLAQAGSLSTILNSGIAWWGWLPAWACWP